MGELFGTDGVRGVANRDLTPELALALGRAAGHVLGGPGHGVIVGRDTRRSGRMLESALATGLCSVGMEVWLTGVIPTPGLAFLARLPEFVAGAVISASHNPAPDNGIKFFDHQGLKLGDEIEEAIEAGLRADLPRPTESGIGRIGDRRDLVDFYAGWLLGRAPSLRGVRVVIDCANGSTYRVAPKVLGGTGVDLRVIFAEPDGTNINAGCGSSDPAALQRAVVESSAACGFAFDGDGDRIVAVDERGERIDGDALLGILALDFRRRGELAGNVVVGTVMTNGGLEATLRRENIVLVRTQVGDKHIWEELERRDAALGGETSGHVIMRSISSSGDGILTALRVLTIMRERRATLSELASSIDVWPQVLRNVHVQRRAEWRRVAPFAAKVDAAERNPELRTVVRSSGTEPVLRILVEARNPTVAQSTADELAKAAEEYLA